MPAWRDLTDDTAPIQQGNPPPHIPTGYIEIIECLDGHADDPCEGDVEYRMPLSATGRSFPRCDKHWEARLVEVARPGEALVDLVLGLQREDY